MLHIQINRDEIHFGASVTLRLARTLRLPAGDLLKCAKDDFEFGTLPIYRLADYTKNWPTGSYRRADLFAPLADQESVDICLAGRYWKPNAIKIGFGQTNVLTGAAWSIPLSDQPSDYVVCPPVCCINGGFAHTIKERQLSSEDHEWAEMLATCPPLRVCVYEPRPNLYEHWPEFNTACPTSAIAHGMPVSQDDCEPVKEDKLYAALPQLRADMWEQNSVLQTHIYLVDPDLFQRITGQQAPESPITRKDYLAAGLVWHEQHEKN